MERPLELGREMTDKITGFTGIATSKHFYLTGCAQYGLQPKMREDGTVPDKQYFDEGRLKVIGVGVSGDEVTAATVGCDRRPNPERP